MELLPKMDFKSSTHTQKKRNQSILQKNILQVRKQDLVLLSFKTVVLNGKNLAAKCLLGYALKPHLSASLSARTLIHGIWHDIVRSTVTKVCQYRSKWIRASHKHNVHQSNFRFILFSWNQTNLFEKMANGFGIENNDKNSKMVYPER